MIAKETQNGVVALKWKDKREVFILTTKHHLDFVPTGRKDRNDVDIYKPTAVMAYNDAKSGIDVSDQLTAYNTSLRKTVRWYHKIATELLIGTSLANSWIAFRSYQT